MPKLGGHDANMLEAEHVHDLVALAPVDQDRLNLFLQDDLGWLFRVCRLCQSPCSKKSLLDRGSRNVAMKRLLRAFTVFQNDLSKTSRGCDRNISQCDSTDWSHRMPYSRGGKKPSITHRSDCNVHHVVRSRCRHAHEREAVRDIRKHCCVSNVKTD